MPKVNNVKGPVIYESKILRMNSSIILTFTIAVLSMSTKILFGFLFVCITLITNHAFVFGVLLFVIILLPF